MLFRSWSNGPARLGYGDLSVATAVGFGADTTNRNVTTYFRRAFTVPWNVTLTNLGNGDMLVEWGVAGNDMATASITCPGDPPSPAIPGQPGPSLLQTAPTQFQLPVAGGVQPLSGGFTDGGDGWVNTGTITVRPAGVARIG